MRSGIGMAGGWALCAMLAGPLLAAPGVEVGPAEPLLAIEASRTAIVRRIVADYGDELAARGFDADALRYALVTLRADQLLAAALVASLDEVLALAVAPVTDGPARQRYVAINPLGPGSRFPAAAAYLVRDGEALWVETAAAFALRSANAQVVGYFEPVVQAVAAPAVATRTVTEKDGSSSGNGSWLGRTTGGNLASGTNSAVAAGSSNVAGGQGAFVGAGTANQANGVSSLVIGGFDNRATAIDALVGAGAGNRATGARAIVVGGGYNLASGQFSFIGGGGRDGVENGPAGSDAKDHVVSGNFGVVAGGQGNRVTDHYGLVAGGQGNRAGDAAGTAGDATHATVAGGLGNVASGSYSVVGGGNANTASGAGSTVAGGIGNVASGGVAAIGGGNTNTASGVGSTIGGGNGNAATGQDATVGGGSANIASGRAATVPGGAGNQALGDYAVAVGRRAVVNGAGSFLFADGSADTDATTTNANEFAVAATGGIVFATSRDLAGGNGCRLAAGGGSWACTSDRAAKTGFEPVDTTAIIDKLVDLPISTWRFRGEQEGVRHMGPMAQDFRAAFDLGEDERTITAVDVDGVALAAIQGLNRRLVEANRAKEQHIAQLEASLHELAAAKDAQLRQFERELAAIRARVGSRQMD